MLAFIATLLVLVSYSEKYGVWVWAFPPVIIAVIAGLSIRYQGVRSVAASAGAGALDAIGEWWKTSGSGRTKERRSIPAEIKRIVLERANGVCEHPDCARKTRNHFHHIDENPSQNIRSNIVYICPNHHDEAHRGLIPQSEQKRWARRRGRPKAQPARSKTS